MGTHFEINVEKTLASKARALASLRLLVTFWAHMAHFHGKKYVNMYDVEDLVSVQLIGESLDNLRVHST